MEGRDVLLLIVATAEGERLTPVQVQKSLFLVERAQLKDMPERFYQFEPYHYGPFSRAIYDDADSLHTEGYVSRLPSPVGTWVDTAATPAGLQKASQLKATLSPETVNYLQAVTDWVRSQPFHALISAIYRIYPEFRSSSVFVE